MVWLAGWNRRKSILVNGSIAGIQTDYQMKLVINEGSGTDSPGIIYCSGNIKSDFSDLRFTDSGGSTEVYYFIESITGTSPNQSATVWVKISSIPTIGTTIYVYYNNPTPSDGYGTNGNNTFIFFDDFPTSSLDVTKWTALSGGTIGYSISGSIFTASGTIPNDSIVRGYNTISTFGLGTAFRGRINVNYTTEQSAQIGFGRYTYPSLSNCFTCVDYSGAIGNVLGYIAISNGTAVTGASWNSDSNYHIWDLIRTSSTSHTAIISGELLNNILTVNVPSANMPITLGASNFGGRTWPYTYYVDWVLIRNFVSPEPTFSTTGLEELTTPANITATSLAITPSETPCIEGSCTVTVDVIWTNNGGTSGTFLPNITIDTVPISPDPYPSQELAPSANVTKTFIVSGLTTGTHNICPNPN